MSFQRLDVAASPEEAYLSSLRERVEPVRKKTWTELSPEEKDLVAEFVAYQSGLVAAPK